MEPTRAIAEHGWDALLGSSYTTFTTTFSESCAYLVDSVLHLLNKIVDVLNRSLAWFEAYAHEHPDRALGVIVSVVICTVAALIIRFVCCSPTPSPYVPIPESTPAPVSTPTPLPRRGACSHPSSRTAAQQSSCTMCTAGSLPAPAHTFAHTPTQPTTEETPRPATLPPTTSGTRRRSFELPRTTLHGRRSSAPDLSSLPIHPGSSAPSPGLPPQSPGDASVMAGVVQSNPPVSALSGDAGATTSGTTTSATSDASLVGQTSGVSTMVGVVASTPASGVIPDLYTNAGGASTGSTSSSTSSAGSLGQTPDPSTVVGVVANGASNGVVSNATPGTSTVLPGATPDLSLLSLPGTASAASSGSTSSSTSSAGSGGQTPDLSAVVGVVANGASNGVVSNATPGTSTVQPGAAGDLSLLSLPGVPSVIANGTSNGSAAPKPSNLTIVTGTSTSSMMGTGTVTATNTPHELGVFVSPAHANIAVILPLASDTAPMTTTVISGPDPDEDMSAVLEGGDLTNTQRRGRLAPHIAALVNPIEAKVQDPRKEAEARLRAAAALNAHVRQSGHI